MSEELNPTAKEQGAGAQKPAAPQAQQPAVPAAEQSLPWLVLPPHVRQQLLQSLP